MIKNNEKHFLKQYFINHNFSKYNTLNEKFDQNNSKVKWKKKNYFLKKGAFFIIGFTFWFLTLTLIELINVMRTYYEKDYTYKIIKQSIRKLCNAINNAILFVESSFIVLIVSITLFIFTWLKKEITKNVDINNSYINNNN